MRVLLTGHNGDIGSSTFRTLAEAGHDVVVLWRAGAVELRDAYPGNGLTLEFSGDRLTRLENKLQRDELEEPLRWRTEAVSE